MIALIDARSAHCRRTLWGISVVERNIHLLAEQSIHSVFLMSPHTISWKHKSLTRKVDLHVLPEGGFQSAITQALRGRDEPIVILDGSVLPDRRVIATLVQQTRSSGVISADKAEGMVLVTPADHERLASEMVDDISSLRDRTASWMQHISVSDIDPYLTSLRHKVPPRMIRIAKNLDVEDAERELFRLSYKGGLDFIYQFVYRHIVRLLIRVLAPTSVTPNQLTIGYLLIALTAMPFLAMGFTGIGLLICLAAMIGDSADGALARITFQTSKLGHRLDKHSHRIYHSLWYITTAIGLSKGDVRSPVFWNGFVLVAVYLISRQVTGKFKDRFRVSIFDVTPYDRFFRYVSGARWNINMMILGLGVALQHAAEAFFVMTAWGLVALAVWTSRHFTTSLPIVRS